MHRCEFNGEWDDDSDKSLSLHKQFLIYFSDKIVTNRKVLGLSGHLGEMRLSFWSEGIASAEQHILFRYRYVLGVLEDKGYLLPKETAVYEENFEDEKELITRLII